jgi:hypothetical protein
MRSIEVNIGAILIRHLDLVRRLQQDCRHRVEIPRYRDTGKGNARNRDRFRTGLTLRRPRYQRLEDRRPVDVGTRLKTIVDSGDETHALQAVCSLARDELTSRT